VRDYIGPVIGGVRELPFGVLTSVLPDAEPVPEVADAANQWIDDFLHD
jgi:hypothetical protein